MARTTDVSLDTAAPGEGRLTGRHVLIWLGAFFGVVFAVNATMMHLAISTFSGMEDESPYKNGLAYNTDIDAGRRQNERHWNVDAQVARTGEGATRITVTALDAQGAPLSGLAGTLRLERPADRRFDHAVPLQPSATGAYAADLGSVEPGQWDVVIALGRGGDTLFQSRNRIILK